MEIVDKKAPKKIFCPFAYDAHKRIYKNIIYVFGFEKPTPKEFFNIQFFYMSIEKGVLCVCNASTRFTRLFVFQSYFQIISICAAGMFDAMGNIL